MSDMASQNMIFIEESLIALCRVDTEFFIPLSAFMYAVDRDESINVAAFYTAGHIMRDGFRQAVAALRPYISVRLTSDLDHNLTLIAHHFNALLNKYELTIGYSPASNETNMPVPTAGRKDVQMADTFKTNDRNAEINDIVKILNDVRSKMSENAVKEVEECLTATAGMKKSDNEYIKNMQFLRTVTRLPWGKVSEDNTDISEVEKMLDESHYGLDETKERIIEFLAINKLKADAEAPKFLMLGAPGTGKTSLAQAIGKALGRKVQRVSMGGVSDASTIKGHRRTYVGSVQGRIIDAVIKAGTDNPIIILDEIDKLVTGQGDPQGALLELLDKEQNHEFTDYYLNFDYDLSKVIFIATANYHDRIDGALLDRMELLEISGYTLEEKLTIARKYILPQVEEGNGLEKGFVIFHKASIKHLVEGYTREAGLRRLQQSMNKLVRKVAVEVAKGKKAPGVTKKFVEKHMGERYFEPEIAMEHYVPGLMHGLYYSSAGGGALPMEAVPTDNSGAIQITGQAGDVMIESLQIAYGYLKAHGLYYGIEPEMLIDAGVQVHMPDGSTPKDGPSAGLAFVTLLASALSNTCVKDGLAMTGEVTLHGFAKRIGGVYEKVTGGIRDGIKEFILPEENRRDYNELPASVKRAAKFHFVSHVEEVLAIALDMYYDENRFDYVEDDEEDSPVMTA